jgi:hypothetical protein
MRSLDDERRGCAGSRRPVHFEALDLESLEFQAADVQPDAAGRLCAAGRAEQQDGGERSRVSRCHMRTSIGHNGMNRHLIWLAAAALAACATTTGPDITIDYDRSADLSSFQTYGFPKELGTDRAGYSTLITTYFKNAVNREMEKRGFAFDANDPDLLVNFFANVRDVTEVRSMPSSSYGYYGYRYGLYGAWPYYDEDVSTVHYKVGTANVDIVDAERMQLIWEGVAEGRITREDMKNPQPAIDAVVTELFQRFSGSAATGKPLDGTSD